MTADALKKITTDALDKLAALLDEGHSDQLTALLKTMARFHKYSWHNVCLIASQCPTATRVAGFQTWRTMGRYVRKGEKGIAIMAPIIGRHDAEPQPEGENARTVVGFRAAYVFDIAQTDGEPLPNPGQVSGDPGSALEGLRAAVGAQGITLEYVEHLGGALGTSSGGRVQVIAGLAPAVEFLVVAHEHAHEIMHHCEDRPDSRETRELEAEAVAFVVAQAIGIDASNTARDYIHLYHGDSAALAQSLDRIQKTAAAIIRALDSAA